MKFNIMKRAGIAFCFLLLQGVFSQVGFDSLQPCHLTTVRITDSTDVKLFKGHPGSVAVVTAAELKRLNLLTGNEVFRKITGINVVDEEGLGLRANIGIRGLDPDRSRNAMVLEDGIPVALNPYGEPELYFTPSMERMEGVEVVKGSGQILYGPQTVGGVINYITAAPSLVPRVRLRLNGGQGGLLSALAGYSATSGNVGYDVSFFRKQADQVGYIGFNLNDFNTKFVFSLGQGTDLTFKLGLYDESSNATYIGLTQPMYDLGGSDFVQMSPNDLLHIQRASSSAIFRKKFNQQLEFKTVVFLNGISRNWRRQNFSSALNSNSKHTGVVWGDTSVNGGAVFMDSTTLSRDRQFLVMGVEPSIHWNTQRGILHNQLTAGLRVIKETAFEQGVRGTFPTAQSGALVSNEVRNGIAMSAYLQNRLSLQERLHFIPGVRVELYDFSRTIHRASNKDTLIYATDLVASVIPGFGVSYLLGSNVHLFSGVHRGFAPPRIKDAITNLGEVYQLAPELSWNFELGMRYAFLTAIQAEFTVFHMDFSNQIIPVSLSSGGTGTGLVNGGATLHSGFEAAIKLDMGNLLKWSKSEGGIDLGLTYVRAVINQDRLVQSGADTINVKGNRTPYAPEWLLTSTLWYTSPFGLGFNVTTHYQSDMFADVSNTVNPSSNGRVGLIDGRFLADVSLYYEWAKTGLRFNFSVKNVTDERYIASRRPQGIRVGLPRYLFFGISWNFGG
jgi:Fe(3+) dicitrate transport protein